MPAASLVIAEQFVVAGTFIHQVISAINWAGFSCSAELWSVHTVGHSTLDLCIQLAAPQIAKQNRILFTRSATF